MISKKYGTRASALIFTILVAAVFSVGRVHAGSFGAEVSPAEEKFSSSDAFVANDSICRRIKSMATKMKRSYNSGQTNADIISSMGGANALESWEWAVISYVGQFKYSQDVSPAGVGNLTYDKCKAGGFDEN